MTGVSCRLVVSGSGEGITWILLLMFLYTKLWTIGSSDTENTFYRRQSEVSLMWDSKQLLSELQSNCAPTNRLTKKLIWNDTNLSLIVSIWAGSKSISVTSYILSNLTIALRNLNFTFLGLLAHLFFEVNHYFCPKKNNYKILQTDPFYNTIIW